LKTSQLPLACRAKSFRRNVLRITIVGSGYVGLVSGACFAEFGHHVICVDTDADKIARLQAGEIPIFEPGLDDVVARNMARGRLVFQTSLASAVAASEVVLIAVGTPTRRGDGHADLTYVRAAATEIADAVEGYTVVVTKSTVPVGTGSEIAALIKARRPSADVDVVSNPEFLREGAALEDFMRPNRVVVGTLVERARGVMRDLYRPLFLSDTPIVFTDIESSELIKYAANAYLATKIGFINEIADLCDKLGGNVSDVAKGIGLDNRIGAKFLHPGPGYGGSCFPKDTLALVKSAHQVGVPMQIVSATIAANDQRKSAMVDIIIKACGGSVRGKTLAILGLTFKPNTDDMRDAPSVVIVPGLQQAGAKIQAYDPEGRHEAEKMLSDIVYAENAYAALEGADAVVILTEWNEFRALDLQRVRNTLRQPVFIDLRNIYKKAEMQEKGFSYVSLGRP
jgi:UDPglucose 6-dehydrogenase